MQKEWRGRGRPVALSVGQLGRVCTAHLILFWGWLLLSCARFLYIFFSYDPVVRPRLRPKQNSEYDKKKHNSIIIRLQYYRIYSIVHGGAHLILFWGWILLSCAQIFNHILGFIYIKFRNSG
jgi:hypothetical protein